MEIKRSCATIAFALFCLCTLSQSVDTTRPLHGYKQVKDFSLLAGYSYGHYGFTEIGFAINRYGYQARHPYEVDLYLSEEINARDRITTGTKVGFWTGFGFGFGMNMIFYTNYSQGCFVFRPETGLCIAKFRLVYGYNWNFTRSFEGINQHLVAAAYCFKLKRLKYISVPE